MFICVYQRDKSIERRSVYCQYLEPVPWDEMSASMDSHVASIQESVDTTTTINFLNLYLFSSLSLHLIYLPRIHRSHRQQQDQDESRPRSTPN